MDMIAKQATVSSVKADGSGFEVKLAGNTVAISHVKNATGRKLMTGQTVLVHYRGGSLTAGNYLYVTAILEGAID